LDNASIHRADYTRNAAQLLGIPLVFNLPYRPDLMGIEYMWCHAKAAFRTAINKYRKVGIDWTNEY
jgi:transposase